jgi:plastocyanin
MTTDDTMTRRGVLGVAAGTTMAALAGCLTAGAESAPDASSAQPEPTDSAAVRMVTTSDGFHFEPHVVWVTPGGTVTWTLESGRHSTTAYHPANDHPLRIPQDAAPWNSGILSETGATFEHTFAIEGVYDYFCIPHESFGMVGSVIVGSPDPSTQPALDPPQASIPEAARTELKAHHEQVRELLGTAMDTPTPTETPTETPEQPTASVTFADQPSDGTNVVVQSVTMSAGGFVTIHDSSLLEGDALGSVVGVSKALASGTHEHVPVTLFEGVPGAEFDTQQLTESQTLIAMPHLDTNENGTYDFITSMGAEDGPYIADGTAVVDKAMITVKEENMTDEDQETKKPMASVTFKEQPSDGASVTVQSITMSKGGFATIHDSSLLDGNVFGSVIGVSEKLDAGTHEDVEVKLFEGVPGADFEQQMLKEDQKLIAMPHLDTNDNATYDFITSGGKNDGPYIADGTAVVDPGCVHVCE